MVFKLPFHPFSTTAFATVGTVAAAVARGTEEIDVDVLVSTDDTTGKSLSSTVHAAFIPDKIGTVDFFDDVDEEEMKQSLDLENTARRFIRGDFGGQLRDRATDYGMPKGPTQDLDLGILEGSSGSAPNEHRELGNNAFFCSDDESVSVDLHFFGGEYWYDNRFHVFYNGQYFSSEYLTGSIGTITVEVECPGPDTYFQVLVTQKANPMYLGLVSWDLGGSGGYIYATGDAVIPKYWIFDYSYYDRSRFFSCDGGSSAPCGENGKVYITGNVYFNFTSTPTASPTASPTVSKKNSKKKVAIHDTEYLRQSKKLQVRD